MREKVLILGGKPLGTIDIVNYLQNKGYYVIVTDNLSEDISIAKQIADEKWDISTAEVDLICEKAKLYNVKAVFTGIHDFNINMTCEICNKLNLPFYATKEQLYKTSTKSIYKEIFKQFDVPVVPEYKLESNELEIFANNVQYPILIKPSDSSAGRGISICNNKNELKMGYDKAIANSPKNEILIEQYIQSIEVTIFYIIQDGKIMLSAMADRYLKNVNNLENTIPLPTLYTFPSIHLNKYINELNDKVINTLQSFELKNGMVFIQSFANSEQFLFYDMGFRLTGTQEYHILETLCNYNPLKMMTNFALTGIMDDNNIQNKVDPFLNGNYAFIISISGKSGIINKYIGLDKIESFDGVIKVIKSYPIGYAIPQSAIGTLNQVVLRVLGVSKSKDEMKNLINNIVNEIDILDENNNSILLPIFNTDEVI